MRHSVRHAKKLALLTSLLIGSMGVASFADSTVPVDSQTLQRLIDKVDKQESEIQDLKAELAQRPATPQATTEPSAVVAAPQTGGSDATAGQLAKQQAEIDAVKAQVSDAANTASAEEETYPSISFHGFGDVDYHTSTQKEDKNSFTLGEFDAFTTAQLAENISVLNETVVSPDQNNVYGIEIERLLLQMRFNDYFNLDVGRYHTALGYYNTAFHHGTWFQTDVGRPEFLNFEDSGGILPVHNVGLSAHGTIPYAPPSLGMQYIAELGNGRDYVSETSPTNPVNNIFDDNNYKATNIAFISKPEAIPGLQFGAGWYHDTLNPVGINRTEEDILHSHLVYKDQDWEWLSEAYGMYHGTEDGPSTWSKAFYVQLGRKFGKITPYARFTYLDADPKDEVYQLVGQSGRHWGPSIGVRYDLSDYVALKAQYDYEFNSAAYFDPGPTFNPIAKQDFSRLTLQVAFTF